MASSVWDYFGVSRELTLLNQIDFDIESAKIKIKQMQSALQDFQSDLIPTNYTEYWSRSWQDSMSTPTENRYLQEVLPVRPKKVDVQPVRTVASIPYGIDDVRIEHHVGRCEYCGSRKVQTESHHCPNCGAPQ